MFLAGLFITVPYSVSYLAFAITGKADRKLPIVINSFRHLHSSPTRLVSMVVERSVELYTYSIDITQQHEHFPQF